VAAKVLLEAVSRQPTDEPRGRHRKRPKLTPSRLNGPTALPTTRLPTYLQTPTIPASCAISPPEGGSVTQGAPARLSGCNSTSTRVRSEESISLTGLMTGTGCNFEAG